MQTRDCGKRDKENSESAAESTQLVPQPLIPSSLAPVEGVSVKRGKALFSCIASSNEKLGLAQLGQKWLRGACTNAALATWPRDASLPRSISSIFLLA